jgi:uncharacterized protein YjbI with pentapeptide repeats
MPVLLLVLTVILFALGAGFTWAAWRLAGNRNQKWVNRGQVLGGLGGGILTGAVVALGVLVLQQHVDAVSAEASWRLSVELSPDLRGFDPAGHSLVGMNLSGKDLRDANLSGANMTGVQLRDTNLYGANLNNANLHGAVLYNADLANTSPEVLT